MAEKQTIGALQDEIKHRDRRIEELRREVDELRDLVRRLEEHAEEYTSCMEAWKESFDMVETENGGWTWAPFWDEHNEVIDDYNKLVRDWNRAKARPESNEACAGLRRGGTRRLRTSIPNRPKHRGERRSQHDDGDQ